MRTGRLSLISWNQLVVNYNFLLCRKAGVFQTIAYGISMNREIIITIDGSHSIAIPAMGVTYHSTHGAIQESMHVFIESGLRYINNLNTPPPAISIFEMGFGTGLNALLTMIEAGNRHQPIYYETIESHPLELAMALSLNYCEQLQQPGLEPFFAQMHQCNWNSEIALTPYFTFKKIHTTLEEYTPNRKFTLVYFDAFAPDIQPHVWTTGVFQKLYDTMKEGALLTTYCSKSIVRKAMTAAGLQVDKIPGPPHKREMVRAVKKQ